MRALILILLLSGCVSNSIPISDKKCPNFEKSYQDKQIRKKLYKEYRKELREMKKDSINNRNSMPKFRN